MAGNEADGALDHALVGEDAAVAEPLGPVQPHMVAGAGIAPGMIGGNLAVVGCMDDQRRHRRLGKLAVTGEFAAAAGRLVASTRSAMATCERGPTLSMRLKSSKIAGSELGAAISTSRSAATGWMPLTEPATALAATAPPKEWPTIAANGPNHSPATLAASTALTMFRRRPCDWPWPGRSSETTL